MMLQTLLESIRTKLATQTTHPVYFVYDPAAFQTRETTMFLLGLDTLALDQPFQASDATYAAFSAKLCLTLLMPQETDARTISALLFETLLSGLELSGYAVSEISYEAPSYARQFRRLQMRAEFTLSGVVRTTEEAVTT